MKKLYRFLDISMIPAIGMFAITLMAAFVIWEIQGYGRNETSMILGCISVFFFLYFLVVMGILEGKEY